VGGRGDTPRPAKCTKRDMTRSFYVVDVQLLVDRSSHSAVNPPYPGIVPYHILV
jgi:hypothetical protein